ncbi:LuxR C-terminal-related transcriptional regulator [Oligoflexia bacterium]|nr:LuxR C-terminal-related transcriptional regulator [Oligoflexia bacterium]
MKNKQESSELSDGYTTNVLLRANKNIIASHRSWASATFFVIASLGIADITLDIMRGVPPQHVYFEAFIILLIIFGLALLWLKSVGTLKRETFVLREQVLAASGDAQRWANESSKFMAGLGVAIDAQFDRWELSTAEKEVGLFLLKGLSSKEIAALRFTSEKTVRQQATAIYRKANLEGRAQLSAFFLEDLLLPAEKA